NMSLERGAQGAAERNPGTITYMRDGPWFRPGGEDTCQMSFAKMRQGGMDVGFFAIDVTRALKSHLAYAMDGFGYLFDDVETSGADVAFVRSAADIDRAAAAGKLGILLAIEHADGIEHSLNVLHALYRLGVRSIGLTHHTSSAAADGCYEARPNTGLTPFGKDLVREMNRLGMVVDLAHISTSGFYSALEVSERPVMFSHGNVRALCDHPRNLDDDQLRALAQKRGVIGLSFVKDFVAERKEDATLERLLDHADHVVEVAGIDTVGLGSDFDGGGELLPDVTHLPRITEGLLHRGYSDEDVRKLLGGNTLRFLRETIG
ncbi:MAG: dipeptidase, partial [Anaerolineae bacterium]